VYELLIENGYKNVQMLCHDQRDISFAESIDGIGYYYTSDIYEYLSLIKKSPLIVSMRVHSSLPSAALKTPFVNISYDQRGQSLMSAIGLEDWDINLLLDDNPIDLIRDRINSLSKLNSLIESNSTLWDGLYDKQLEAINKL
jgi:polysaccharide pyruvyl transferase WcaK-like protein